MDIQNGHHTSVINQTLTSVQDTDKQHNIQDVQHNFPPRTSKDQK